MAGLLAMQPNFPTEMMTITLFSPIFMYLKMFRCSLLLHAANKLNIRTFFVVESWQSGLPQYWLRLVSDATESVYQDFGSESAQFARRGGNMITTRNTPENNVAVWSSVGRQCDAFCASGAFLGSLCKTFYDKCTSGTPTIRTFQS